jgi:YbgC/YbaW family acyl-CoA thioester hydrolase
MSGRSDRLTFTLSYGDCDTVGIIYFARYFPWMERCSTLWWHSHGIRVGHLSEDHEVVIVGVNASLDYHSPARVFDEITVRLVSDSIGSSSFALGFEFTCEERLLARGRMTFACRDLSWEKSELPAALREPLEALANYSAAEHTTKEVDGAAN